jgi:hypothetical protein
MAWNLFGGSQPVKPWLLGYGNAYTGGGMSQQAYSQYQQDMSRWEEKMRLQKQRQQIFLEMAQNTGPLAKPYKSRMGLREAVPGLSTIQPPGAGMAPVDEGALYGRPDRKKRIASIVNLGLA